MTALPSHQLKKPHVKTDLPCPPFQPTPQPLSAAGRHDLLRTRRRHTQKVCARDATWCQSTENTFYIEREHILYRLGVNQEHQQHFTPRVLSAFSFERKRYIISTQPRRARLCPPPPPPPRSFAVPLSASHTHTQTH